MHTSGCAGGQTGWGLRSLVWANLVGMVMLWVLARPITTQQRLQHAWACIINLVGHARGPIAHQGLRWGQTGWGLCSLVWANLVSMVVRWGLARLINTPQRLQHGWACIVTLVEHARGPIAQQGCAGGQSGWGLRSLVWANVVGMVLLLVLTRPITTQQRLQHAWACIVTLLWHARGPTAHQGLRWGPNWLGAA